MVYIKRTPKYWLTPKGIPLYVTTKKIMRYFFISFSHSLGFGRITIDLEEFPSEAGILQTIFEENPDINNVTILSLHEFKTKEDFDSFCGNKKD